MATTAAEDLTEAARVRRAASLIYYSAGADLVVFNFLSKTELSCRHEALQLLSLLSDWTSLSEILDSYPNFSPSSVLSQLIPLSESSVIVLEGTAAAVQDEEYRRSWEWGATAGLYHFGIRDSAWSSRDEARAFLQTRYAERHSPKLYSEHAPGKALPLPSVDASSALYKNMDARRSTRLFLDAPISSECLAECLYSGFGIVAFLDDPLLGRVPFKWAPSPGARNAFEAYVYVRHVAGLERGLYHYSGAGHSLMPLGTRNSPSVGELLGNQGNLDNASAVIFLVAQFDRVMWKYPHPNGYRTVLIEAGHIAQNILLSATSNGIACLPTCATNDGAVRAFLTLSLVNQSAIHAVVLGIGDAASPAME